MGAEELLGRLNVPGAFPTWVNGILLASSNVDTVVDYSWSMLKWWMIMKHRQNAPNGADRSSWGGQWLCHPTHLCTPSPCFSDERPVREQIPGKDQVTVEHPQQAEGIGRSGVNPV